MAVRTLMVMADMAGDTTAAATSSATRNSRCEDDDNDDDDDDEDSIVVFFGEEGEAWGKWEAVGEKRREAHFVVAEVFFAAKKFWRAKI